jgi:thiamine-phosphate pyrophosphorylase
MKRSAGATTSLTIRGFYAVIDRDDEALAHALVDPARGGAGVLQVRIKPGATDDVIRVARMARAVTRAYGAALVIDDRVDIARLVGADGVHLGQTDLPIDAARRIGGGGLAIGVSTHDVKQVIAAVRAGADYLGFGPVFATMTKANPDPVQGIAGLRRAVIAAGDIPVVAIGGITPDHAGTIAETGAAGACVIGAVNGAPDPIEAARQIQAAWRN